LALAGPPVEAGDAYRSVQHDAADAAVALGIDTAVDDRKRLADIAELADDPRCVGPRARVHGAFVVGDGIAAVGVIRGAGTLIRRDELERIRSSWKPVLDLADRRQFVVGVRRDSPTSV